jgi:hypothetical protein
MQDEMMKIVAKKFGIAATVDVADLDGDELFERVVNLALSDVPQALGQYVGRAMYRVMAYGDFCGWDSTREDAETFTREFLQGFYAGINADDKPESFPEREKVIAAFEAVVGEAKRATGLELLTY